MTANPRNASPLVAFAFALLARAAIFAATVVVLDSFERMLAHGLAHTAPVVSVRAEADPVIAPLVEPLRQWPTERSAPAYGTVALSAPTDR